MGKLDQGRGADNFSVAHSQITGQGCRRGGQAGGHGHKSNRDTGFSDNQSRIQAAAIVPQRGCSTLHD